MSRFTLTEHLDECMVLETKFGKLVAWVVRNDEDFKEFAIDLIGNDGKEYQVACNGMISSTCIADYDVDIVFLKNLNDTVKFLFNFCQGKVFDKLV